MTAAPPKKKNTFALAKRLVCTYLRPYYRKLLWTVLLMVISGAMTGALAQLMKPILDDVLFGKDGSAVVPIAFMVLATFLVRGITTYLHTLNMNHIGQSIVADIQYDLFSHLVGLDLEFFHNSPSGRLISCVVNDVNIMRLAVSDSLTGFGKSAFTLVSLILVMFFQDWKLSVASFVVFPFAAFFVAYLGKRLRKVSGSIQNELAVLSDFLSQIFQGIRLVMAYGMEDHERSRARKVTNKVRDLNIKSVRLGQLSTPVNEVLVGFVVFGIVLYGGHQVASGALTGGQIASFLAAFTLAYEPMKKLAKLNNSLQMGLGASERVFALLDTPPTIASPDKPVVLPQPRKIEIELDNVHFKYKEANDNALDSISFNVKSDQVVALVGHSGSGKSTIMNLIPRFYDVDDGAVRLNGVDVRQLSLADLRGAISLVSQDITIFDDTIENNILYGRADATEAEVVEAAKAASAHEFILDLPEGYQTRTGEDGVKLSGGQRQRIAIARAILRDAPVLLLDEATSALDNESEQIVQQAIHRLEKGRTTLVIAHRLSTVQAADEIIVLEQGKIIERGNHEALMEMNGAYAKMYKAGFKG